MHVVATEPPTPRSVGGKHAVGMAVATYDHCDAGDNAVSRQQVRHAETFLSCEVLNDDRRIHGECEPWRGVVASGDSCATHEAVAPADASPQEEPFPIRQQFEEPDELDGEDMSDPGCGRVHEGCQIAVDERLPAEFRDGLLLTRPARH